MGITRLGPRSPENRLEKTNEFSPLELRSSRGCWTIHLTHLYWLLLFHVKHRTGVYSGCRSIDFESKYRRHH